MPIYYYYYYSCLTTPVLLTAATPALFIIFGIVSVRAHKFLCKFIIKSLRPQVLRSVLDQNAVTYYTGPCDHVPGCPLTCAHVPGCTLTCAHVPGCTLTCTHVPGCPLTCAHVPSRPGWMDGGREGAPSCSGILSVTHPAVRHACQHPPTQPCAVPANTHPPSHAPRLPTPSGVHIHPGGVLYRRGAQKHTGKAGRPRQGGEGEAG